MHGDIGGVVWIYLAIMAMPIGAGLALLLAVIGYWRRTLRRYRVPILFFYFAPLLYALLVQSQSRVDLVPGGPLFGVVPAVGVLLLVVAFLPTRDTERRVFVLERGMRWAMLLSVPSAVAIALFIVDRILVALGNYTFLLTFNVSALVVACFVLIPVCSAVLTGWAIARFTATRNVPGWLTGAAAGNAVVFAIFYRMVTL